MTNAQTEARAIARCVRGCATDDQYIELVERIATALEAQAAELAAKDRQINGINEERRGALDLCIQRNKEIQALAAQLAEKEAENERLKNLSDGLHDEVQFMREKAVTNGQQHRAAEARLAEALKALDETDRILRDIERHETTRVVDAQDRISIARRVREGGKVE